MKKILVLLAAFMAAFVIASPQGDNDYLNLDVDKFVEGGIPDSKISTELLPSYNAVAKNQKAKEAISFSFNYDISKLQIQFKSPSGKVYTRTGKLPKGQKLIATVNRRTEKNGEWIVDATVRWAQHCGNPLTKPFKVVLTVPKWGDTTVVFKNVYIPKTELVTVEKDVVVQQLVPDLRDIEINVSQSAPARYRLEVVGEKEAGRRWEYQKDFWDNALDLLKVVAYPLGLIFQNVGSTRISATATGGAGGAGGTVCNTNNNSNSNSNSNVNTISVNTGSGSSSASGAGSSNSNSSAGR